MISVYLDACCLNRPFDDQTQDRIRIESEAVLLILRNIEIGEWQCLGSEVLDFEIQQSPDVERRRRVQMLASLADMRVPVDPDAIRRAEQLTALGFHPYDALHIACAELGKADIFLTTDEQLLRVATRASADLHIRVDNPLSWLREEMTR